MIEVTQGATAPPRLTRPTRDPLSHARRLLAEEPEWHEPARALGHNGLPCRACRERRCLQHRQPHLVTRGTDVWIPRPKDRTNAAPPRKGAKEIMHGALGLEWWVTFSILPALSPSHTAHSCGGYPLESEGQVICAAGSATTKSTARICPVMYRHGGWMPTSHANASLLGSRWKSDGGGSDLLRTSTVQDGRDAPGTVPWQPARRRASREGALHWGPLPRRAPHGGTDARPRLL